jgi:hypothetical protein
MAFEIVIVIVVDDSMNKEDNNHNCYHYYHNYKTASESDTKDFAVDKMGLQIVPTHMCLAAIELLA